MDRETKQEFRELRNQLGEMTRAFLRVNGGGGGSNGGGGGAAAQRPSGNGGVGGGPQLGDWGKLGKIASEAELGLSRVSGALRNVMNTALTVANTVKGVMDDVSSMANAPALNIANATAKLVSYNQDLISIAGQFSKYGVGIREVESQMKSLRDATGLTYNETMQLMSAYESGFNFTSLQGGEQLMMNLRKAVGSNVEAMKSMMQQVQGLAQKFPDLEMSLVRLNSVDKQRLAVQSQLLVASGQISLSEAKGIQNYINQNAQPTQGDKKRLGAADDELMSIKKVAQTFEDVLMGMKDTVGKYWKDLGDAISANKGWLEKHNQTIADTILGLEAFQKALSIWNGTGGAILGFLAGGGKSILTGVGRMIGMGGGEAAAGAEAAGAAGAGGGGALSAITSGNGLIGGAVGKVVVPITAGVDGAIAGRALSEHYLGKKDETDFLYMNKMFGTGKARSNDLAGVWGGAIAGAGVGAVTGGPVGAAVGGIAGLAKGTYDAVADTQSYVKAVYADVDKQNKEIAAAMIASADKLGGIADGKLKSAAEKEAQAAQANAAGDHDRAADLLNDAGREKQDASLDRKKEKNQKAFAHADTIFQSWRHEGAGMFSSGNGSNDELADIDTFVKDTEAKLGKKKDLSDPERARLEAARNYKELRNNRTEINQAQASIHSEQEWATKRQTAMKTGSVDDILSMQEADATRQRDMADQKRQAMKMAVMKKTGKTKITDAEMKDYEDSGMNEAEGFGALGNERDQQVSKLQGLSDPAGREAARKAVAEKREKILREQRAMTEQQRAEQLNARVNEGFTVGRIDRAFNTGNIAGLYEEQRQAGEALKNSTIDPNAIKADTNFAQIQKGEFALDDEQKSKIFAANGGVKRGTDTTAAIDTQMNEAEARLKDVQAKIEEGKRNGAGDAELAVLKSQEGEAKNVLGYWGEIRKEQVKGQQELQKTNDMISAGMTAKLNAARISIEAMNQKYAAQKALLQTMIETMQATGDVNVDRLNEGLSSALKSNVEIAVAQKKQLDQEKQLGEWNNVLAKKQEETAKAQMAAVEQQALGSGGAGRIAELRGKGTANLSKGEMEELANLQDQVQKKLAGSGKEGQKAAVAYADSMREVDAAQAGTASSQAAIDKAQIEQQNLLKSLEKERLDLARQAVTAYDGQLQKLAAISQLRQATTGFRDESGAGAAEGGANRSRQEAAIQAQIAEEKKKIAGYDNARAQLEKNIDESIAKGLLPASAKEAEMARGKAQLDTEEVKSNQELLGLKRELLNVLRSFTELNKLNLELARSEVSQAEMMVSLSDSVGVGIKASADQRWKVVEALEKEYSLQTQNLQVIKDAEQEKVKALGQARSTGDKKGIEEAEGAYKTIHNERIKKETEILGIQQKQLEATRAMRDGYVSAIASMTTGAGVFQKIVVDQEHNFGGFVATTRGAVQSLTTGGTGRNGMRAGMDEVGTMRTDSLGNVRVSSQSDDNYYKIYNAGGALGEKAGRLQQGIRDDIRNGNIGGISDKLHAMNGKNSSMASQAGGANANMLGAYAQNGGFPDGTQPGAQAANTGDAAAGGKTGNLVAGTATSESKSMLDVVTDIRDMIARWFGASAPAGGPTTSGNRQFNNSIPTAPGARTTSGGEAASNGAPTGGGLEVMSGREFSQQADSRANGVGNQSQEEYRTRGLGGAGSGVGLYGVDGNGNPISAEDMDAYAHSGDGQTHNNMNTRLLGGARNPRYSTRRGLGEGIAGIDRATGGNRSPQTTMADAKRRQANIQRRQEQAARAAAHVMAGRRAIAEGALETLKMTPEQRQARIEQDIQSKREMYEHNGRGDKFNEGDARKSAEAKYTTAQAYSSLNSVGVNKEQADAALSRQQQQAGGRGSTGTLRGSSNGTRAVDGLDGGGAGGGGGLGIEVTVKGIEDLANKVADAVREEINKKGAGNINVAALVKILMGGQSGHSVSANQPMSG